ncbi:MAG: hypothetical protein QM642_06610 [Edaphocola sp.]
MATLNFSFAGTSIQAAKLSVKEKKFDLLLDKPEGIISASVTYPVSYFNSINNYAENLNEAFHLIAAEKGITVSELAIRVTGYLQTEHARPNIYRKIDIELLVAANTDTAELIEILLLANELSPLEGEASNYGTLKPHFSLNNTIHLN